MDLFFRRISLILLLVLSASQARGQDPTPIKVGQIFIAGNSVTPDYIIRATAGIYPAQPVSAQRLKKAEDDLARLGLFQVDGARGIRPIVLLLKDEADQAPEFCDILISVNERPGNKYRFLGYYLLHLWVTCHPCDLEHIHHLLINFRALD